MSQEKPENRIDYIEIPVSNIARAKQFYSAVFGWKFEDYGPDYTSFFDGRLGGGFKLDESPAHGILLVLYASDLTATQQKIKSAGGAIVKDTFSFPGGRRFHFADPNGIELAVWSDV
jgi:uncharacterized protein